MSQYERSDVSAIAAASVVAENVVALEITRAMREKFGGDSMREVHAQLDAFLALGSE
jgi:chorismate synthase